MANRKQQGFIAWVGTLLLAISTQGFAQPQKQEVDRLPLEDVQRFSTAISQIKSYYVKPINDKKLFEHAIRGMLSGLDPHSTYLDEKDFAELRQSTRGEFGGLGIEVTMDQGLIKIITPLDDTPAHKAGLKAGDLIIRLDDKLVRDMSLRDAVSLMRGKKGSKIKLMVLRKGLDKPMTFVLTRETIHINSVKSKLFDGGYGYIRVSHFQEPTARDLRKALTSLAKKSGGLLKGLILDLRNNPGGLLDSAIEMSDIFIHNDSKGKEELIVYTKGRLPGSEFTAAATPGDVLKDAPIIVLINEGSASGSEIVAGALKDNKRAIILGTKSFGKGSVQTILPLDDKRGIKLTTALYYTPSGRSIQAEGIVPDIVINNVNVPKKDKKEKNPFALKEADLKGHLDNGSAHKTKKKKNTTEDATLLIYEDYQLHEALNLLKALALVKK